MKWIFLFAYLTMLSCSSADRDAHTSNTETHTSKREDTKENTLALNDGVKWETDASTRLHAASLVALSDTFQSHTEASPSDQLAFANAVDTTLQRLVKDCKMKGEAHDALHLWLQPVIEDVKQLKQAIQTDAGNEAALRLVQDIKKFNQFFN